MKKFLLALIALTVLVGWSHGGGGGNVAPTIVTSSLLPAFTPATNGQVIGTVAATQNPTSFALVSCSGCTGYFAISNAGVVTVTPTGAAGITGIAYTQFVTASNATGTSASSPVTITFSSAGSCPQGSGLGDGCPGAQVAGTALHTHFFIGYTGVNYGANRPSWNVAGVDYPVGYNGALTAVASASLPSGASYSTTNGGTVSINADTTGNYNFQNIDFSGTCLLISGSTGKTLTFTNDKFTTNDTCSGAGNPAAASAVIVPGSANVNFVFNYVTEDQAYDANLNSFVSPNGTSTVTITYSDFERMACRLISFGGTNSHTLKYNYWEGMGAAANGCHGETVEYNTSTTVATYDEEYNNLYFSAASCNGGGTSCSTSWPYITSSAPGSCTGGLITNATFSNNVAIAYTPVPGGGTGMGFVIRVDVTFANSITNLTTNNNYIDGAATFGPYLVASTGSCPGTITTKTCTGNKNISASSTTSLTGSFGSGGATVTCS